MRVPFREIALTDPQQPTFRVYDPSGPYTDAHATIDVEKGLPRIREAWVRARGGVEDYLGREVKPEDIGNVTGKHAARDIGSQMGRLGPVGRALFHGHAIVKQGCNRKEFEIGRRLLGRDVLDQPPHPQEMGMIVGAVTFRRTAAPGAQHGFHQRLVRRKALRQFVRHPAPMVSVSVSLG